MTNLRTAETRAIENTPVFEPKIVAYLCTWCSYTGADTAGIARLNSPANIRAIRVPCSGRVSPELIMRTFDQGADGVLVLGCHIGECHYDSGNHRTAKRLPTLQALMTFAGLEPERLRLDWVSASEGERFARIATEFTDAVRPLGPSRWQPRACEWGIPRRFIENEPVDDLGKPSLTQFVVLCPPERCEQYTSVIQATARQLLTNKEVRCVIGYEKGSHGRTRPIFIYHPKDVERLIWNPECTHNLVTYLTQAVAKGSGSSVGDKPTKLAIVAKPCDSRAINVLLGEGRLKREQLYVIGIVYERRIYPQGAGPVTPLEIDEQPRLQSRCLTCDERTPIVYDTLIGEAPKLGLRSSRPENPVLSKLEALLPPQRLDYWLNQFDRCIRCYACRQACPMCDCPTCLYERDDSLWIGMGIGLNEKRAFHLGRAYHLAGRCVGCNECERVCPMDIPISLINLQLAKEVERTFGYRPGRSPTPSPFVTILGHEEVQP
jgi:coenzyme F420-reducing hydrogenase delta subunit/ferredoxin